MLTIVMYHYVRDLQKSRYPDIKGLDIKLFREQIEYITKNYSVIAMEDLIYAFDSGQSLPPRPLLLTFDDGYRDHFDYVLPTLDEKKLQGSFFPPAKCICESQVLDVNKIHFVLASVSDKSRIANTIVEYVNSHRSQYKLNDVSYYIKEYAVPNRWDSAEVIFIKRMLQVALPEELRGTITNKLFRDFVSQDEPAFAEELYMSLDQVKYMKRNGMFIGSHSYNHYWLDSLEPAEQEVEVDKSISFLKDIGCSCDELVMCYPYGAYNEPLMTLINQRGFKLGLTTNVGLVDLNKANPFLLPRLDTNDLPKSRCASSNEWTELA